MNSAAERLYLKSLGTVDVETERSAVGAAYACIERHSTIARSAHYVEKTPHEYCKPAPDWQKSMRGIEGKLNHHIKASTKHFLAEKLHFLPSPIKTYLAREFVRRVNASSNTNKLRSGNIFIRRKAEILERVWNQYPFAKKQLSSLVNHRKSKAMTNTANRCAGLALTALQQGAEQAEDKKWLAAYRAAAAVCQQWGIAPPYEHAVENDLNELAAECAMLRMICPKWWLRKLLRLRDQCIEHLYIAAGMVGSRSPYISSQSLREYNEQQAGAREWLESTIIENADGVTLPLVDAADAGVANPSNRFIELVVRARGLEELADDAGKAGYFITLTAPSKFHANSGKWQENNPKAAQAFLVEQWAKTRATLTKSGIDFLGMRVTEPHKDGTPHWHMCLFLDPTQADEALAIIKRYALAVDGDEPGADKRRFVLEPISKAKGSAVGYVIKYISKNLNGEWKTLDKDLESGRSGKEGAQLATAWASRWRLRQFQFFGTASVTIWRELRRIRENTKPELDAAHTAADSSNWLAFEQSLAVTPLELDYEIEEYGNDYGEVVKRIKGLAGYQFSVETHKDTWTVQGMTKDEKGRLLNLKKLRKGWEIQNKNKRKDEWTQKPTWFDVSRSSGRSRAPWTCGNNCNQWPERVTDALKTVGITGEGVDWLMDGRQVFAPGDTETAYQLRNGELREIVNQHYPPELWPQKDQKTTTEEIINQWILTQSEQNTPQLVN
jgi:hypothetical protein